MIPKAGQAMSECKECERLRAELKKVCVDQSLNRKIIRRLSEKAGAALAENETLRATVTGLEEQLAVYQQQVAIEEGR